MPTTDAVRRGLAWGSIGFGTAGLVDPGALSAAYGIEGDEGAGYFARTWATRNVALGYLSLHAATPAEKRAIDSACAVLNGIDALVAASSSGQSAGFRVRSALTSAAFSAGCAWLVLTES